MTNSKILNFLIIFGRIFWIVILIDFVCYVAWTISGQTPVDGFYLGAITNHILSVIK